MNKTYTFEDFLSDKHAEDYVGLDDDMPACFCDFMENLEVDDVIEYAQEYADKCVKKALENNHE